MSQPVSESEARGRRPRWFGFVQLVLILAAIAAALYFARAPERVVRGVASDLTDERARPAVSVVRPVPVEPALTVELTGSVRMDRRVRVASEVVGRVVRVSPEFRNGGSLAAKETFIRVDPAEYELEVKAAEHALREARARVWIETSRGRQSAESFALAHPGEEVPDFARNAPSIEKAEAQVMKARVALGLARLRLERTRISLPFDVRVVRSDVAVGELVGPAELVGPSSRLGVVYRPASIEMDAPMDLEVMTMAVSSSVAGENELRLAAEELRDGLLGLPSISLVTLEGTRDREISIELSEEELRRNDLTINRVANAVRRASLNLTFGELRTEAGGVVLHTVGKRRAGKEFEDIPLITRLDGTIVTLGDIAEVRDGFVDEDVVSRFDGRPAVFVRVDAAEGQSIVDIADEMRAWLSTWEAPQDITIEIWNDRVSPIFDRFSSIVRNGVIGAVLVFICLVLVFDLRVAFWVTLGIPLSLVGSLLFFGPANLTLNMGTLFAFFLLIRCRGGRRGGGRGEHRGGARTRQERACRGGLGRPIRGEAHHRRRLDDHPRLPSAALRDRGQLSDRERLSLGRAVRSPDLARRSVLHPSRPPGARAALERAPAERRPGLGPSVAG